MRKGALTFLAAAIGLASLPGCSVYCALTEPGPVDVDSVHVGSKETEVRAIFGNPKTTDEHGKDTIESYEFVDGLPGWSKTRAVGYVAGDLFTVCLAEVIFWPAELALLNGQAGRAEVVYDPNLIAKEVVVTTKDGKPWKFKDNNHPPAKSTQK